MALRKRSKRAAKAVPERLSMFHRKGRSWGRDLDPGTLQVLLQSALESGGIAAQVSWEQAGQLGTALLLPEWPEFLPAPAAAFLRRSPRKPCGIELAVDLDGDLEVQEYGEDLRRFLMGEQRLTEVQSSIAVDQEPVVVVPPVVETAPVVEAVPVAESAPVVDTPADPIAEETPAVEVIAPGTRAESAHGRSWSQAPDDLFGLAGEIHPDDQADHGLGITTADLPWLNPGDSIISPRRGPCRIKRVEDEARQVVAKDENKQMIVITFRELLAEFQFDDGN